MDEDSYPDLIEKLMTRYSEERDRMKSLDDEASKLRAENLELEIEWLKIADIARQLYSIVLGVEVNNKLNNIDDSNYVTRVLFVYFYYLKTTADPNYCGKNWGGSTVILRSETKIKIRDMAIQYPFNFLLAEPLIITLMKFYSNFNEIRLRPVSLPIKTGPRYLHDFGLNPTHQVLCYGITFSPQESLGNLKSLGPMTLAIKLNREQRLPEPYKEALEESIQHIPYHTKICQVLSQSTDIERTLLKELADVLMLYPRRSKKNTALPLVMMLLAVGKQREITPITNPDSSQEELMLLFNDFTFLFKTNGSAEMAKQVVYHSMFQTYLEDLGVMSTIFGEEAFFSREKLRPFFTDRIKAQPVEFQLLIPTYIPKLSNAFPPKFIDPQHAGMLICRPVFAGRRKRSYSTAFYFYLFLGNRNNTVGNSTNPDSLARGLRDFQKCLQEKPRDEEKVKWKRLTTGSDGVNHYVEVDDNISGNGTQFFK